MHTWTLPAPVAAYFAAEHDPHTLASCFTPQAVMKDDGHTYAGRDAIVSFMAEASARYKATSVPFALQPDGDRQVVRAKGSGNFPGSPIELSYRFALEGDRIASVEITA